MTVWQGVLVSEPTATTAGVRSFEEYVTTRSAALLRFAYLAVSYTHLRAHETALDLVRRLLLEKKETP